MAKVKSEMRELAIKQLGKGPGKDEVAAFLLNEYPFYRIFLVCWIVRVR